MDATNHGDNSRETALRDQVTLSPGPDYGTIQRRLVIFSQLIRHLTAIVYLVAELVLGFKPEKL